MSGMAYQTLEVSEDREVELRRGEWLLLLSAWEGSAWVPDRAGRGGRARRAVAGRAQGDSKPCEVSLKPSFLFWLQILTLLKCFRDKKMEFNSMQEIGT